MSHQETITNAPEEPKKNPAPKEVSLVSDDARRKMANAVLETTTSVMNPVEHEQLRKLAKEYWLAGALPKSYQNPDQLMLAMQFGRTMGMTPYESIVNGYFVNGSYNVWGKAIPAALRRHGWSWKFFDETPDSCSVDLKNRMTHEAIVDTFTHQDAVASGFTKDSYGKEKVGWRPGANRRRKLRYGALSQVLHTYIPEVLGAVAGIAEYSEDYLEAEQGSIQDRSTDRREKIKAAEAQRQAELNDDFEPEVIEPEPKEAVEEPQTPDEGA
jgi:hypothetical protein